MNENKIRQLSARGDGASNKGLRASQRAGGWQGLAQADVTAAPPLLPRLRPGVLGERQKRHLSIVTYGWREIGRTGVDLNNGCGTGYLH